MDTIFLYSSPHTVRVKQGQIYDHILEVLDESDQLNEKKIHELIFKFAASEGLITAREDELAINPGEDTGSWKWFITTINFRSLVRRVMYDRFIQSLSMGEGYPVDKIIDLHFRLGTLFDHKLLNTLVNRLYSSIGLIPFIVQEDDYVSDWEDIHIETPFLWICIMIQVLLRTEIGRNTGD